jgi:hypothetical protein
VSKRASIVKENPRVMVWLEDMALAARFGGFVPVDPEQRAFMLEYVRGDD